MSVLIVCVMGVAGAGKSTVGRLLASELRCEFLDADTLHPSANIEKMSRGIPLDDADRAPWLAAIHARIVESFRHGQNLVIACSALKQRYRETLADGVGIIWVYLKGTEEVVRRRLQNRQHHFMKPEMVASQFADLEEPADAIVIDLLVEPPVTVRQILSALSPARAQAS